MTTATELWEYRSLVYNLAQRDLRARYKRSVLGWLWSLINPATTLLIYSLVFGAILEVTPPPAHDPSVQVYALYLFTGLVVWNAFSAVLTGAIGSLQAMGGLLNKVYFPPATPALANTVSTSSQTLIEAGILILATALLGNGSWSMWLLPLVFVPVLAFALGIGLALSAYNVLYRDVGYLVALALNVLFYLSPIVYPITLVPEEVGGLPLRRIIELNPLTKFVTMARDLVYFGRLPASRTVVYACVVSAVVLVLGWAVFERKARAIVEEL
jgi:ABC-type polysaccharide/polyol phosphate export permease